MKRVIIVLVLCLNFLAGAAFGTPVSVDMAEQAAENWMDHIKSDYYEVRIITETFTESDEQTEV